MSIPTAGESMFDLDTQPQHVGHGSHRCASAPYKAAKERANKRSVDWKQSLAICVAFSVLEGCSTSKS